MSEYSVTLDYFDLYPVFRIFYGLHLVKCLFYRYHKEVTTPTAYCLHLFREDPVLDMYAGTCSDVTGARLRPWHSHITELSCCEIQRK